MGCHAVEQAAKVIAVCGVKNSGKTTLLEKLVSELSRQGVKTAVIKHDGHDFACDIPGTDSYRLWRAGAYGTAVFSRNRIFVHKEGTREKVPELVKLFPEADLILVEGMKDSSYPKIEVVRKAVSTEAVSNPEGRFLIVTDLESSAFSEETAGFGDIELILKQIRNIIER